MFSILFSLPSPSQPPNTYNLSLHDVKPCDCLGLGESPETFLDKLIHIDVLRSYICRSFRRPRETFNGLLFRFVQTCGESQETKYLNATWRDSAHDDWEYQNNSFLQKQTVCHSPRRSHETIWQQAKSSHHSEQDDSMSFARAQKSTSRSRVLPRSRFTTSKINSEKMGHANLKT